MRLAFQRLARFKSLGQKEDLDTSITHLTEAILVHPFRTDTLCVRFLGHFAVTMLFQLAQGLVLRYNIFRKPEDLISSLNYLRYLRDNFYPIEAFQVARDTFLSTFVQALAHHVILKTGDDESEHFREMADSLRELGTKNFSEGHSNPLTAMKWLYEAVITIYRFPDSRHPPDQLIEVLREVMVHNPDSPESERILLALSVCLNNRFCMTHVMDEYEEALSIVDKFFASHPITGGSVTPAQGNALYMVMWILDSGFTSNAKPEHLEDAISRLRALLCLPSLPPSSRADITKSLDRFVQQRSLYFGATGNSAETPLNDSGVVPSSSLSPMLTSNQSTAELANDVMAQSNEDKRLEELLIAIRNNENTDVEEIVKLGRTLQPPDHSRYGPSNRHHTFAEIIFEAYQRTNTLGYLDEAISIYRSIYKNSPQTISRHVAKLGLLARLIQRWKVLHHRQDMDEIMELYAVLADDKYRQVYERLKQSCQWAFTARVVAHPSTSVAYEKAMSVARHSRLFPDLANSALSSR